ncbi:MAG: sigma-70 family RNA polymerase sigma factor [Armatimonadetes bacterium]|nr:sigma-70 family RNA polymerase sigma factor [Armatimonadota bacterium]MBS1727491.1 RNA polymerase sigma factor [Armatimonadota bacterium]
MGPKLGGDEKKRLAAALWDDHGAAVYRFALRLTGNRSIAEDLVGETILAALQSARRKPIEEMHRSYLFGITLNRWRRLRHIPTEPIDDLVSSEAVDMDSLLDLERAFRALPKSLQEAFVLVKAEGFTSKEAAEILRLPQGTVQSRVHEAVHRLRDQLEIEPLTPTKLHEATL